MKNTSTNSLLFETASPFTRRAVVRAVLELGIPPGKAVDSVTLGTIAECQMRGTRYTKRTSSKAQCEKLGDLVEDGFGLPSG